MAIEIIVPPLGESVAEATVSRWLKNVGDSVAADEAVAELETDKVTLEVPAPSAGVITGHAVGEGETVIPNAVIAVLDENATAAAKPAPAAKQEARKDEVKATPAPVSPAPVSPALAPAASAPASAPAPSAAANASLPLSPAVKRLVEENSLNPAAIPATGKDGRITKGDVLKAIETGTASAPAASAPSAPQAAKPAPRVDDIREERVPMTRLRRVIASRLKEAQNNAAMLTTFNEVDMSAVMALRSEYKESFEKSYGVRLGFMSFFVKAVISALKEFPAVNAEIHGDDIIYKNFYNIGVAVGTPQGLVVPVLKDADVMSFAETEASVNAFGLKARDGQLSMADLSGGTFTISNGGVYGSMMSTPILNPPQSGILGMHNIQKRAVVISGKDGDRIEIRPMMYLALSYDHRIIDGREAVSFLVRIKSMIEDPRRLLLGL
jgi:2-oxoglutarate dehydrogenase E2 component (dihydrolipoamide succinyltransferase)